MWNYDEHMPTREPDDNLYRLIGLRVANFRNKKKISQAALAEQVGVARTSVTNLESGRQRVTLDHLNQIAEVLGVELSELMPTRKQLRQKVVTPDVQQFGREFGLDIPVDE